jgi:hypothetical protein
MLVAIDRKYERDVDVLLAEEFEVSPPFAEWFLQQIKGFTHLEAQVAQVSVSKSDNLGESDLVVVFKRAGVDACFAVFIEDKINAQFQPEQEARYRLRAEAGIRLGYYLDYRIVLCSPEAYRNTHPQADLFDAFVSYESMAAYFAARNPDDPRSLYRANFLATAAPKAGTAWKATPDPVTNAFWAVAYDIATREFPDLEMRKPVFTKGQTWIDFRPLDMPTTPRRVIVSLKADRGLVDLTFAGTLSRFFSPLATPLLDADMTVHQTGKSVAIRLVVECFSVSAPDDASLLKVRAAFVACVRLIRFYRTQRRELDEAASKSVAEPSLGLAPQGLGSVFCGKRID